VAFTSLSTDDWLKIWCQTLSRCTVASDMPLWLKYFQNILYKSLDSGYYGHFNMRNLLKIIITIPLFITQLHILYPLIEFYMCTGKGEIEKANLQRFYCTFLGSHCEEAKQVVVDAIYDSLTSVSC